MPFPPFPPGFAPFIEVPRKRQFRQFEPIFTPRPPQTPDISTVPQPVIPTEQPNVADMYSGPGVFKQPPEYQSPIPPPLSPAQIPAEYQRQAEGLGQTGKDIVPVGLSELLPEGAKSKLPRWAQTGLGMMLDTLRRMAPPPPVSGPGFAITNLAQALAGGLEAPYQRGIEMAKASEELAKQTAQRQLEQQKLATTALYPIHAMDMQRASLFKPDIYQGPYGAWAVTPEGERSLTAPIYQAIGSTFDAAQDSLTQLLNSKDLPEEFRAALKGEMSMFMAALRSGAPPAQLWQMLERLMGYMERAPYLGLSLDRFNLDKFRASIYQARTLLGMSTFKQGQMSLLASHEVTNLVNSLATILKNPNLYSKLSVIQQSPELQAAIEKAGEEVARTMKEPGRFSEYVERLWQRLTTDPKISLQLGKGIFTSPEMTNYYTTLSQVAAWLSFLHTQGKGSVELTLGYSDFLKMFLGPKSVYGMLAALGRYATQLHGAWSALTHSVIGATYEASPVVGGGLYQMSAPLLTKPRLDPEIAAYVQVEEEAKAPGVALETHALSTGTTQPPKGQITTQPPKGKVTNWFTVKPSQQKAR
ncbi:MAG TPA: hypothetical protein VNJ09_07750 [Chthonomonadales bacterium]|nr:hypothetical protein [Chthonomonadales bacterium]